MLKKTCALSNLKLLEDGNGGLSGYGSTWDRDRIGDVIARGAFKKSLDRFKADGFIAVGHAWDQLPVATVSDAYEDEKGLYIEGEFHSTEAAQAARTTVRERLERGKSVGLSIGFDIKDFERTKDGRILKEIELWETSLVTVPCNPAAEVTQAKALYLGDYAAESMTLAALRDCYDSLFYNALYSILFGGDGTTEEKLAQAEAAIGEASSLCVRALRAMLTTAEGDEDARGELETDYKDVFAVPARVAGRLETQVAGVLDALGDVIDRHEKILPLRQAEGRSFRPERWETLAAIQSRIEKLLSARVTETAPSVDSPLLLLQAEIEQSRLALARVSAR